MAAIETYTGRFMKWNDAVSRVKSGLGDIVPLVVKEPKKGETVPSLTYGFFFAEHAPQKMWDIQGNRSSTLKTLGSANQVLMTLMEVYESDWGAKLPYLSEQHVVRPDAVAFVRSLRIQDEVGDNGSVNAAATDI